MTLKSNFELRIPLDRRVQLTNPDDPDATTQNDTLLDEVVKDVIGEFETLGVGVYDDTDARMVAAAIEGVEVKLQVYKGDNPARERHEAWRKYMEDKLRLVTNNNRIKPRSTSAKTPAKESPGGELVRPLFDVNETFDDLIPERQEDIHRHF